MLEKIYKATSPDNWCHLCASTDWSVCTIARFAKHTDLGLHWRKRQEPEGEILLAYGDKPDFVAYVLSGVVRIVKILSNGREEVVDLLYPGDFLGAPLHLPSDFAFEAATDVELLAMDAGDFEAATAKSRELQTAFIRLREREVSLARQRILLFAAQRTLERVAIYLSIRHHRRARLMNQRVQDRAIISLMGRKDLASYLGTTIETVSRHLHHLSRIGVIRIVDNRRFEILDPDRLLHISGVSRDDIRMFWQGCGRLVEIRNGVAALRQ